MDLPPELAREQEVIERHAERFGLSFFRVIFEMVDYDQMNILAAYSGFPIRYPHWRFGMEYQHLSKSYEYGLHRIYEMVVNNDPTYAYLLEGNTHVDQKLVMAHVYGHADFFRNNVYFAHTNRKMIDEMANHATRIRRAVERHGIDAVERFADACLSAEDLIDPTAVFRPVPRPAPPDDAAERPTVGRLPAAKPYLDRYVNPPAYLDEQRRRLERREQERRRFPPAPERDVLGFLMTHAPLDKWELDVLGTVREESYYFLPQIQTKIMNEGWASYWHTRIMTERILRDSEVVDYADRHAGTVAVSPGRLNPYKLGLELFRDIERRWDRGQFGPEWETCDDMAERGAWDRQLGLGREKIFEVRRLHCDSTFLDEFLTREFCEQQRLFVAEQDDDSDEPAVVTRDFDKVKQALLLQFSNGGRPVIELQDANHANRSELLLAHRHMGLDLRLDWAKEVLENLVRIWKRPVRLDTRIGGKAVRLGHDGERTSEEDLDDPPQAASR